MKITAISVQAKNSGRVNISIDGAYRLSLTLAQLADAKLKTGQEISEAQLAEYEQESAFGKLAARAIEYCLMRPHSAQEVRDYLWRKTRPTKYKSRRSGEIKERSGVAPELTNRVYDMLVEKGYIDDESFTRFWVEYRNQRKGTSRRKLQAELRAKGVSIATIDQVLSQSDRSDGDELQKVLQKKRAKYPDETKLIASLMRQGFHFDDITRALRETSEIEN